MWAPPEKQSWISVRLSRPDMLDLFNTPLTALTQADVQQFLDGNPAEALYWEAKGTQASADEVRKQVCGFANSHDGGFLILGAELQGSNWVLDGVEIPGNDPPVWITNVAQAVRPTPDGIDAQAIPISGTKWLVVVWIPPTPAPPCNVAGRVYERVAGQTIPVVASLRLAELFARGDTCRGRAQQRAVRAASDALVEGRQHPRYALAHAQFGLALAAAGYGVDFASGIFTRTFEQGARSSIQTVLFHDGLTSGPQTLHTDMLQNTISVTSVSADDRMGYSWQLRARRDGVISLYWVQGVGEINVSSLVAQPLKQAWTCVEEVMRPLQPTGPRYLAIEAAGARFPHNAENLGGPLPRPAVERGPLASGLPDEDVLSSVERELRRARGEHVYEP